MVTISNVGQRYKFVSLSSSKYSS